MTASERFRLLYTYTTPACRIGQRVRCAVFGEVEVVGYSEAPLPWPVCRRGKWRVPIVFRGLERAVRRESVQAVCHWWSVGIFSVNQWRKELGVKATEGTTRLRRDYFHEPWAAAARAKAHAKNGDSARRAKISAAKRGQPRPPHVLEAMHSAWRGSHHTEETRRRMSESHQRRRKLLSGQSPPADS
jgi:hypothetical protein